MPFNFSDFLKKISTTQDSDTQDNSFPMPDYLSRGTSNSPMPKTIGMGDVKMTESLQPDSDLQKLSSAIATPESDLNFNELYDRFMLSKKEKGLARPATTQNMADHPTPSEPLPAPTQPSTSKPMSNEDDELNLAIKERNDRQIGAALLRAGSQLGNAIARTKIKTGEETADTMMKLAGQDVDDVKMKQKLASDKLQQKIQGQQLQKGELDLADAAKMADPNSQQSILMRNEYLRLFPEAKNHLPADISAKQMGDLGLPLGKLVDSYENRRNELLKRQMMLDMKKAQKEDDLTIGQKSVDKDYAKHYNDFTSKGKTNAAASIQRLEQVASEMEKDKGLFQSGGGRVAVLPDALRSREAIRRRDLARNAANSSLKELFGGQLSDAEREAAAKEYYNDNLDNATNAKILRDKIQQLKAGLNNETEKAKHYEKFGTLKGYRSLQESANSAGKIKVSNGKETLLIDPSDLKDAENDGYKKVQ